MGNGSSIVANGPPKGIGWQWVKWVVQTIVIPLLALAMTVGSYVLALRLAAKEDSFEAHQEHAEIRQSILRNTLLRDQPPEWFTRWAEAQRAEISAEVSRLDKRLERIEDRQR